MIWKITAAVGLVFFCMGCQRAVTEIPQNRPGEEEMHFSAPDGGTSGTVSAAFVEEFLQPGTELLQIEVGLNRDRDYRVVQCIRFEYLNRRGRRQRLVIGEDRRADFAPPYRVPEYSQLVGISGRSGWYIDAVQFHFSDGSVSPEVGGPGGDIAFRTELAQNRDGSYRGAVRGLYGNAGDFIETLGLMFWPPE